MATLLELMAMSTGPKSWPWPEDPAEQGLYLMQRVKDQLALDGMPRTSRMAGGGLEGWTTAYGSTGFSIAPTDAKWDGPGHAGRLRMHVVISGKVAGLRYRTWTEHRGSNGEMDFSEPLEAGANAKARVVADSVRRLGIVVHAAKYSGAQTHWDDDVEYTLYVDPPPGLVVQTRSDIARLERLAEKTKRCSPG